MNNKTLVLAAVVAIVACAAGAVVISEELSAEAVQAPKITDSNVSVTEKTVKVLGTTDVGFNLELTGPIDDVGVKYAAYWYGAEKNGEAEPGAWTVMDGSTVTTNGVAFEVSSAGNSTYDYHFQTADLGNVTTILLAFVLQPYTGALENGVALTEFVQKVFYKVTFTVVKPTDMTFGSKNHWVSFVKGTGLTNNNAITELVTNEGEGSWYVTGLPAGLTMNSKGLISGVPTTENTEGTPVTITITTADSVIVGKVTIKVTASNDPVVTLTGVAGARALTATGETDDSESYLTKSGSAVTFDITGTNIAGNYSYIVYAVDGSNGGEVALNPGAEALIKADTKTAYSFTPTGEGQFYFKVKLFDATGTQLLGSSALFSLLVIQESKDVDAGIVFTPALTPATPTPVV